MNLNIFVTNCIKEIKNYLVKTNLYTLDSFDNIKIYTRWTYSTSVEYMGMFQVDKLHCKEEYYFECIYSNINDRLNINCFKKYDTISNKIRDTRYRKLDICLNCNKVVTEPRDLTLCDSCLDYFCSDCIVNIKKDEMKLNFCTECMTYSKTQLTP